MRGVLSMKLDLELRPGANRFVSESGALAYLDTILADFNQPVVITGEKVLLLSPRFIPAN